MADYFEGTFYEVYPFLYLGNERYRILNHKKSKIIRTQKLKGFSIKKISQTFKKDDDGR
jgi:hypothetical protein